MAEPGEIAAAPGAVAPGAVAPGPVAPAPAPAATTRLPDVDLSGEVDDTRKDVEKDRTKQRSTATKKANTAGAKAWTAWCAAPANTLAQHVRTAPTKQVMNDKVTKAKATLFFVRHVVHRGDAARHASRCRGEPAADGHEA